MKKKISYLVASLIITVVMCTGVCLAVFLPKNTKADTDPSTQTNASTTIIETDATTVTGADTAPISDKGGAIFLEKDAIFTMTGGEMFGHSKKYGGAVYVSEGAWFIMEDGVITDNRARYGGAIYIEKGGHCWIKGGSITGNGAEASPAIHVEPGAELIMDDPAVLGNNFTIDYGYTINYYVDGVLRSSTEIDSEASITQFNLGDAPLDYEESCGYFLDENCSYAIEDQDNIYTESSTTTTFKSFNNIKTANPAVPTINSSNMINLYTKTPTMGVFSFAENSDGESYSVSSNTTNYSSLPKEIVFPREYNGYPVTKIGNFSSGSLENNNIKNVVFPNAVEEIGEKSFFGCELQNLNLPNSLKTIRADAFAGTGLSSVYVPKNVGTIEPATEFDVKGGTLGALVVYTESNLLSVGDWCVYSLGVVSSHSVLRSDFSRQEMFDEVETFKALQMQNQDYVIKNGVLVGYNGTKANVKIPEGVIAISPFMEWASTVESVFVPSSVYSIEAYFNDASGASLPFKGISKVAFENKNNITQISNYWDCEQLYFSQEGGVSGVKLETVEGLTSSNFESTIVSMGIGTKNNPFKIGSLSDLKNYINKYGSIQEGSTDAVQNWGSVVRYYTYSSSTNKWSLSNYETNTKYFRLTSDIDFSEATIDIVAECASWSIDGNNYEFKNLNGEKMNYYLFGEVYDFEIKNAKISSVNRIASITYIIRGGENNFENITITSGDEEYIYLTANDKNTGVLNLFTLGGTTTFKNVVNEADYMSLAEYFGIFVGGYAMGTNTEVHFVNCVNNGDIISSGGSGVFFGNGAHSPGTWSLTNCVNNGTLSSKDNSNIIAHKSYSLKSDCFDFSAGGVVEQYNKTVTGKLTQNGKIETIESHLTAIFRGFDIVVSNAGESGSILSGNYKVVVNSKMSFKPTDGSDSSTKFPITLEYSINTTSDSYTFEDIYLTFIDKETYLAKGYSNLISWTNYGDTGYRYCVDKVNGFYVFDTNGEWYMPERFIGLTTYTIVATDSTGKVIDFAVDEYEPTTDIVVVIDGESSIIKRTDKISHEYVDNNYYFYAGGRELACIIGYYEEEVVVDYDENGGPITETLSYCFENFSVYYYTQTNEMCRMSDCYPDEIDFSKYPDAITWHFEPYYGN